MKTKRPVGWLKRSSPTILICISAIGLVGTAVLSAKAAPKAKELLEEAVKQKGEKLSKTELVKVAAPVYIPAIAAGALTLFCMFSATALSKKTQATITSAYAMLDQSYRRYQSKVKDIYGEQAHKEIVGEIVKEDAENQTITAQGFVDSTLDFGQDDEVVRRFYDSFSGRAFDSTIEKVIQAEYHLNRCMNVGGGCECINRFYEFLGLSPIPGGDQIGWDVGEQEIYWVDFDHSIITLDDGFEYCVIDFVFDPIPLGS